MKQNTRRIVAMKDWRLNTPIKFWEKNPDAIGRTVHASISHKFILHVLQTTFEPFSKSSYYVSVIARGILSDNLSRGVYKREELFGAETAIADGIQSLHEYFDTRIQQSVSRLEMAGFSLEETRAKAQDYEAISVTNATSNYLDILVKADIYLMVVHYLWLVGELASNTRESDMEKQRCEKEVRDALVNLTRMAERHNGVIHRICREAMDNANKRRVQAAVKKARKGKRDKQTEKNLGQAQAEQNALASGEAVVAPEPVAAGG